LVGAISASLTKVTLSNSSALPGHGTEAGSS
jgi:hypothetical protein